MCEGYDAAGDDDRPNLEDELLCEYVDGTMDPVVQEVFEEYLQANPELKEHVECLRNTRMLLCRYGCRCRAPRDLHDRLRRTISCELTAGNVPFQLAIVDRLRPYGPIAAAVALFFVVGIVAGGSGNVDGSASYGSQAIEATSPAGDSHRGSPSWAPIRSESSLAPSYSGFTQLPSARSFVISGHGDLSPVRTDSAVTLAVQRGRPIP